MGFKQLFISVLVLGLIYIGFFVTDVNAEIEPPSIPPMPVVLIICDNYNAVNCPVNSDCEFDNTSRGIKEPGKCKLGVGECVCVPERLINISKI